MSLAFRQVLRRTVSSAARPVATSFTSTTPSASFSTHSLPSGPDAVRELGLASHPYLKPQWYGYGQTIPVPADKSKDNVEFEIKRPFKGHKLEVPPPVATTNKEELLMYYKVMSYYRRFEIVADTMYKQRLIRGFCHLYDGQEAIVTGMESVLKRTDSVITAYRDHCHQMSRGDTPESTMSELFGKELGCSRGKGGSMHMYLEKGRFYGGNGIVGAQIPLGAGLAFAHKYKKDGGLCVAAMGDGASNQGQVYEAANMAALWKLPIIFLVENNEYGMGTSAKRAAASTQYYTRGDYIPGIWVDGMDVLAVKTAFQFAADYIRSGKGPLFMECNTYRYHGHSMSDPGISYRSREEVSSVRTERDPIDKVKNWLLEKKWADAADLKAIDKEIRVAVDNCVEVAKNARELSSEELFTDIYRGTPPYYIRTPDFRQSVKFDPKN